MTKFEFEVMISHLVIFFILIFLHFALPYLIYFFKFQDVAFYIHFYL